MARRANRSAKSHPAMSFGGTTRPTPCRVKAIRPVPATMRLPVGASRMASSFFVLYDDLSSRLLRDCANLEKGYRHEELAIHCRDVRDDRLRRRHPPSKGNAK